MFEAKDIHMLVSLDVHLNNVCVNRCAVLIYSKNLKHNALQVTIVSMHELPHIRYRTQLSASSNLLTRHPQDLGFYNYQSPQLFED